MAISKVKLPDNTTQDVHDSRVPGIDSTPTSGSENVITSGGVYNALGTVITDISDCIRLGSVVESNVTITT